MMNSTKITVADFLIKLLSESNIELEEGYFPFLSNENTAEADISIECIAGLPGNPFENEKLVFEAKNETQKFYSIYKSGSNLGFIIYNQQTNEIQQLATLDETYTHWKIYSELTASQTSRHQSRHQLGIINTKLIGKRKPRFPRY